LFCQTNAGKCPKSFSNGDELVALAESGVGDYYQLTSNLCEHLSMHSTPSNRPIFSAFPECALSKTDVTMCKVNGLPMFGDNELHLTSHLCKPIAMHSTPSNRRPILSAFPECTLSKTDVTMCKVNGLPMFGDNELVAGAEYRVGETNCVLTSKNWEHIPMHNIPSNPPLESAIPKTVETNHPLTSNNCEHSAMQHSTFNQSTSVPFTPSNRPILSALESAMPKTVETNYPLTSNNCDYSAMQHSTFNQSTSAQFTPSNQPIMPITDNVMDKVLLVGLYDTLVTYIPDIVCVLVGIFLSLVILQSLVRYIDNRLRKVNIMVIFSVFLVLFLFLANLVAIKLIELVK